MTHMCITLLCIVSEDSVRLYNGEVSKLISLTAGYCSARFNLHMSQQPFNPEIKEDVFAKRQFEKATPFFDARAIAVPDNNVAWVHTNFTVFSCALSSVETCFDVSSFF